METVDIVYFGIFGIMIFSAALWLTVYYLNRDKIQDDPEPSRFPSVTYLVPAYNEEEHIERCLKSLLEMDYPEDKLEIIAINDGSEDNTLEKMRKFSDQIEIIDKENTGKANSLNLALQKVETELVACMDADSFAEEDMLKSMVGYFDEEDVKGVTPAMKVRNPRTWAQKVMWAEYIYNLFLRKLFSIFDSQWVMPGPGSVYETECLRELGGWDESTLTEDMEIAFRMFKNGAIIKNSTNAYVDTESPPTLRGLIKQRTRWYGGYISNALKYREFWLNRDYGNMGVIVIPFNVLWVLVVVFLLAHMFYRVADGIYQLVNTYLLIGSVPLQFNLTVQSISPFHIFYAVLGVSGLIMLLISLRTAEEDLNFWERKVHYLLFLSIYGTLFAVFWVAAVIAKLRGNQTW
ncbi:MAG: cellulose synthase/poly-beta-1,6-N-acetylglucosamine synthase-like glycosyltransferase [Candidatus Nanohaloarchaea archaeon]|jgi:cellulose synthase/poly-beta-1,6-N-acetylglucosamine synthase-like glycosyltransferase